MTTDYAAVAREWITSIKQNLIKDWDSCFNEACFEELTLVNPHDPAAVYEALERRITQLEEDPDAAGVSTPYFVADILQVFVANQNQVEEAYAHRCDPAEPGERLTSVIKRSVEAYVYAEAETAAARLREALPELKARFEELEDAEEEDA